MRSTWLELLLDDGHYTEGDEVVYFIEAQGTGLVKIGIAVNWRSRLRKITVDHRAMAAEAGIEPVPLNVIGVTPGYASLEAWLHSLYRDCHDFDEIVRRALPHWEWFRLPRWDVGVIKRYADHPPEKAAQPWTMGWCLVCSEPFIGRGCSTCSKRCDYLRMKRNRMTAAAFPL
jgi:hypothetical protein